MRDDELRRNVTAELSWDRQVDSDAIEVSAVSGTVALRGTVAGLRLKRAGAGPRHASAALPGSPMNCGYRSRDKDRRDDEDLRGEMLKALTPAGLPTLTMWKDLGATILSLARDLSPRLSSKDK